MVKGRKAYRAKRIYQIIKDFTRSDQFFWLLLCVVVLQAIWWIFSMKANLFDEMHHFKFIEFYTDRYSPFISSQPTSVDYLGDVTRDSNYLFYYILSFPNRVIEIFTASEFIKIISLRAIVLTAYCAGLYYFRKLFIEIGIRRDAVNLGLMAFLLIPGLAPLAAVINYDIAIFFITPLFLLLAIRLMNTNKLSVVSLIRFFILCLFGVLLKFSFVVIATPVVVMVLISLARHDKKNVSDQLKESFAERKVSSILLISLLLLLSILVTERPITNVVKYGNMNPDCSTIMEENRCLANYTSRRNIEFKDSKPENVPPLNPAHFFTGLWIPGNLNTLSTPIYNKAPILLMEITVTASFFAVIALIVMDLRRHWSSLNHKVLLITAVFFVTILILNAYRSYLSLGKPVALSGRYLLPILPILTVFAISTFLQLSHRINHVVKTLLLLTIPIFYLQGAGITTAIVKSDQSMYWTNSNIISINNKLTKIMKIYIIESNPFRRI